jgi:NTE family protein
VPAPPIRRPGRRKGVSLALQGGGAHGAFAWGVLDMLLEDGRLDLRAVSAASAGAMNAVCVADGLLRGGADGARERLDVFWRAVGKAGALYNPSTVGVWDGLFRSLGFGASGLAVADALSRVTSPYDRNPLDFNPLRDILRETVDFERIRREPPLALHIAATNVRTGKAKIFTGDEVTVEAVIASASLPFVFQAATIDGEHYWDGGYAGNPPLFPLIDRAGPRDLVIVHLNPIERAETPTTPDAIMNRMNELTFNATLVAELRALAFARRLVEENWVAGGMRRDVKTLRIHSIRADAAMAELSPGSKFNTEIAFLEELRDRGRATAAAWLDATWRDIGKRSTVDIDAEFLRGEPAPIAAPA